jgi:hypothetical protein
MITLSSFSTGPQNTALQQPHQTLNQTLKVAATSQRESQWEQQRAFEPGGRNGLYSNGDQPSKHTRKRAKRRSPGIKRQGNPRQGLTGKLGVERDSGLTGLPGLRGVTDLPLLPGAEGDEPSSGRRQKKASSPRPVNDDAVEVEEEVAVQPAPEAEPEAEGSDEDADPEALPDLDAADTVADEVVGEEESSSPEVAVGSAVPAVDLPRAKTADTVDEEPLPQLTQGSYSVRLSVPKDEMTPLAPPCSLHIVY